jgi:hypothetical protein
MASYPIRRVRICFSNAQQLNWNPFVNNICPTFCMQTSFRMRATCLTHPWFDNSNNSCRSLFKRLEILALPCECMFSLMNFIVNNQEHFQTTRNSAIHRVNIRNKNQLHRPIANLSCFQKGAYYAGIKIFNSLPSSLTSLVNKMAQFKVALKTYLITHPFCSVAELLMFTNKS